ncbi:MAG: glycosyltransferase family A protein [Tepidisphaeraceae bacterium]
MLPGVIDILMVTYNRLDYTARSLPRLLETCDERMRVWIWHNGDVAGNNAATLDFVMSLQSHPRFHRLHHSPENVRLRGPMNWFWEQSDAEYVAKIDDDNLMPDQWGQSLRAVHEAEPTLGAVACWSFLPGDVVPELVERKLRTVGGHRVMLNPWVAGTGHVMKRACYLQHGPMRDKQSFPNYCVHLGVAGWVNGFYYPFLYMENMDDPRSPFTRLKTEADYQANRSLSAARFGIQTLEQFRARQGVLALEVQRAHPDARRYHGWRHKLGRVKEILARTGRPTPKWES